MERHDQWDDEALAAADRQAAFRRERLATYRMRRAQRCLEAAEGAGLTSDLDSWRGAYARASREAGEASELYAALRWQMVRSLRLPLDEALDRYVDLVRWESDEGKRLLAEEQETTAADERREIADTERAQAHMRDEFLRLLTETEGLTGLDPAQFKVERQSDSHTFVVSWIDPQTAGRAECGPVRLLVGRAVDVGEAWDPSEWRCQHEDGREWHALGFLGAVAFLRGLEDKVEEEER